MKKTILFAALLATGLMAVAKPVDPAEARRIAAHVLGRDVVDATPKHYSECYLFTGADGRGFVLLSADDCTEPLLGYSLTSVFRTDVEMPSHIASFIDGYRDEIAWARSHGARPSAEAAEEWRQLRSGTWVEPKAAIEPLLTSTWDQSPLYNNLCPTDTTTGGSVPVGCVATATSQVMRYWKHPAQGRGSHSYVSKKCGPQSVDYTQAIYNWDIMPDELTNSSSPEQIATVAKLCYEVGVMMDMNYASGGSGAYEHSGGMLQRFSAERGLEDHYFYNPKMYAAFREGYSDEDWKALLTSELAAGRPLIYTGSSSSGGHAFVLDGVSNSRRYHVNWGWGGYNDGYFAMGHLSTGQPGGQMSHFNEMNNALIGVYPITPNESTSVVEVIPADPTMGYVIGSGTYPVSSDRLFLHAIAHPGYRFDHWASGSYVNPIFYYPTVDYRDTAYFVPLAADTLGYGMSVAPNWDTVFTFSHVEWGIRIPAERVPAGKVLSKVENYIYTTGKYVLSIYQGDLEADANLAPLYHDTLSLQSYGLRSIELSEPVALDATQPLWITFAVDSVKYPAGICPHTGNNDGSWIKNPNGQWQLVDTTVIGYYTWVMRGIATDPSSGIERVVDDFPARIYVDGRTVDVEADQPVTIYDVAGRRVCASWNHGLRATLPAAGVYLVCVGESTRKIVVR